MESKINWPMSRINGLLSDLDIDTSKVWRTARKYLKASVIMFLLQRSRLVEHVFEGAIPSVPSINHYFSAMFECCRNGIQSDPCNESRPHRGMWPRLTRLQTQGCTQG